MSAPTGRPTGRPAVPILTRLLDRVVREPDGGCWIWPGAKTPNGYGLISRGGKQSHLRLLVHRVAYEGLVRSVPEGLDLDHLCRVRHCCNPAHLEPVTRQVNLLRGDGPRLTRERRKSHCGYGHEFNDANTYINNGRRYCRACHRERARGRRMQGETT